MPSKIVVDKEKEARDLCNAGRAHAESASTLISEELVTQPGAEQKTMQEQIKAVFLGACEKHDRRTSAMVQADEGYINEQGDDEAPRLKRDELTLKLSDAIVELRELVRGVFGADAVKGLGFSSAAPQDPTQLVRFVREIVSTIKKKIESNSLPTPRKGASLDLKTLVPGLEADAAELSAVLDKVSLENRELQGALSKKNSTMEAFETSRQRTADLFEGLFRYAGLTELADKLRPHRSPPTDPSGTK